MTLFELVGSIFIKNADANDKIGDTSKKAKDMATVIGSAMQTAGDKITAVGKALAPVSAVVGTALGASVKGASDFTDGMSKMSTLFDTTQTSVSDLSKEFLSLSNKTGLSATELAEAGYQALSAGQTVEDVAGFVETAGNLAKAGFTTTTTAVDVLTTAINAYGAEAGTAEEISNKLVRTQNLGKTTVDELASSMGKIIPTASSMGVNIDNLTSGYVSLTKQGIATAEATTYMNSMLNELGDSGTKLGGVLQAKTGKSFQELMDEGYSLADVLQITKDYADENNIAYNELWGSAEAGKAGLAILNGGVEEFNSTVETMASDTNDVGEALDKLNTPSVKAKKALNQIKNSGIELGTSLLTALLPTIDKVASGVEKVTTWFSGLDDGTKNVIGAIMAFVAGLSPVLMVGGKVVKGVGTCIKLIPKIKTAISAVSGGFKALWALLSANPIVLIIGAIVALVAGFIYLWNTSETFRNFWINLWNSVKEIVSSVVSAVVTFFTDLWNQIVTIFTSIAETVSAVWETIKNAVQVGIMVIVEILNLAFTLITLPFRFIWENCKDIIIAVWEAIKTVITDRINTIKTILTVVMNAIRTVISTAWNAIKSVITTVLNAIRSVVSSVWNAIKSVVTTVLNAIKSVISTVWNSIKSVVTSVMNAIKTTISNVWNSAKSVVTNAINGIKTTISTGLNNAKSTVTSVLNAIKSKFSSIMDGAKNIVSNGINAIKSKFNFSWSLPHLSLPHFSVSGSFSLNPPSVPHFDVDWYKKAMDNPFMFTRPTIFDVNPLTGTAKGAGEAGDEVMIGKNTMLGMIREAVAGEIGNMTDVLNAVLERIFRLLSEYLPELAHMDMVLDSGALVAELAPAMDSELGKIIKHKERGN